MFDPALLLTQAANGLVLGGLYVLIAIGLSIVFGLLGIVNFAHGAFFALGAYFGLTLYQQFGWPAVVLAPIGVGLFGMVVERLLIRRLYDKDPLISLIVTFALALLIEAVTRVIWGGIGIPFNPPAFLRACSCGGPCLSPATALGVLHDDRAAGRRYGRSCSYTPYGRILRAGSRDPEMVGLLGIRLPIVLTWCSASAAPRRHRRRAGGAAVDGDAGDAGKRDHARLRGGHDRRPRLLRRRGDRRPAGRRGDDADRAVRPRRPRAR